MGPGFGAGDAGGGWSAFQKCLERPELISEQQWLCGGQDGRQPASPGQDAMVVSGGGPVCVPSTHLPLRPPHLLPAGAASCRPALPQGCPTICGPRGFRREQAWWARWNLALCRGSQPPAASQLDPSVPPPGFMASRQGPLWQLGGQVLEKLKHSISIRDSENIHQEQFPSPEGADLSQRAGAWGQPEPTGPSGWAEQCRAGLQDHGKGPSQSWRKRQRYRSPLCTMPGSRSLTPSTPESS